MLNVLAFAFIGLQIRPILASLDPAPRGRYFAVAGCPPDGDRRPDRLAHVIQCRHQMARTPVRFSSTTPDDASFGWERNLIVLTAFSVVLGTLALQGLTLT
jgi:hypothetical protein